MPFRPIRPSASVQAGPVLATPAEAEQPVVVSPPARTRTPAAPLTTNQPDPNRNPDGSFIVGKGRPPVKHQFQSGQSGNPKGRPKGARGINTLAVEILGAKVPVRTAAGERRMNAAEFAFHKLREMSAKGSLPATIAILGAWRNAVPDEVRAELKLADVPLSAADQQILDALVSATLFGVQQDKVIAAGDEEGRA